MKPIRTWVAIRIIKLAATLCGLTLLIVPWPLDDGQAHPKASRVGKRTSRPSYWLGAWAHEGVCWALAGWSTK
jgi:hypothetical protein